MNSTMVSWLVKMITLVPMIVAGIEKIHGEAPGASKKQMAMDALGLAYGTASTVLPQDQAAIDAATGLTSNLIDNVVTVFNATGAFGASTAPPGATAAAPKPVAAAAAPAAPAQTATQRGN